MVLEYMNHWARQKAERPEEQRQSETGCERKVDAGVIPAALLPCPFCGGSDVHLIPIDDGTDRIDRIRHYVICRCGITVGGSVLEKITRDQWNKRATASEAKQMIQGERGSKIAEFEVLVIKESIRLGLTDAEFTYAIARIIANIAEKKAEASANTDEGTKPSS